MISGTDHSGIVIGTLAVGLSASSAVMAQEQLYALRSPTSPILSELDPATGGELSATFVTGAEAIFSGMEEGAIGVARTVRLAGGDAQRVLARLELELDLERDHEAVTWSEGRHLGCLLEGSLAENLCAKPVNEADADAGFGDTLYRFYQDAYV